MLSVLQVLFFSKLFFAKMKIWLPAGRSEPIRSSPSTLASAVAVVVVVDDLLLIIVFIVVGRLKLFDPGGHALPPVHLLLPHPPDPLPLLTVLTLAQFQNTRSLCEHRFQFPWERNEETENSGEKHRCWGGESQEGLCAGRAPTANWADGADGLFVCSPSSQHTVVHPNPVSTHMWSELNTWSVDHMTASDQLTIWSTARFLVFVHRKYVLKAVTVADTVCTPGLS